MVEPSSVDIYGLLPRGQGDTDQLIETSTAVFDPPDGEHDQQYEYHAFRGAGNEHDHGRAPDTESLTRILDDWDGAIVNGAGHSLWSYEDLGFKLVLNDSTADSPDPPSIGLRIPWEHFREESMFHENSPEVAVEQCIELAVTVFQSFDCRYTFGVGRAEARSVAAEPTRADLENGVTRIHWLDVLPRSLVDTIGRERVVSSSTWDVRDIGTGLVLVSYSNPLDDGLLQVEELNRELGLLDR